MRRNRTAHVQKTLLGKPQGCMTGVEVGEKYQERFDDVLLG
jgi:hypothetical protein